MVKGNFDLNKWDGFKQQDELNLILPIASKLVYEQFRWEVNDFFKLVEETFITILHG